MFFADAQSAGEDAAHVLIDLAFRDPAGIHGGAEGGESAAALQIHLTTESVGSGVRGRGMGFMTGRFGVALPAVVQRPAVGNQQPVVVPFVS